MAYVAFTKQTTTAAASSFQVDLPVHQSGDLLLVFLGNDFSTDVYGAAPSGWFTVVNQTTGGEPCAVYGFYATSSSTATPTFTSANASRAHVATALTVRGAATSSAIDGVSATTSSGHRKTTDTVTPASNNCLIFEFVLTETQSKWGFFECNVKQIASGDASNYNYIIGTHIHETGGTATTAHTFANTTSSANSCSITFAVKDDGTGKIKGQVSPYTTPCDIITPFAANNTLPYYDDGTKNVDPTSLITTIKGTSTTYKATTGYLAIGPYNPIPAKGYNINSSGDWNKYLVAQWGLGNSFDLSDSRVSLTVIGDLLPPVPFDVGTRYIGFGSGDSANVATAAKLFMLEAGDTKVLSRSLTGKNTYVLDITRTADESYGTLTTTAIEKLFIAGYVKSSSEKFGYGFIVKHKPLIGIGGTSTFPCSYDDIALFTQSNILNTVQNQSGSAKSQYFAAQDIQIGDGTRATYWDSSYQSVEFPAEYSATRLDIAYNVNAASFLLNIKAKSGDTVRMLSATCNMGNFHKWEMDAATVNEDIYNFQGLSVLNATVTLRNLSNVDYSGITFSGCKELTTNGADLSGGCTISNCVDAQAITVTSEAEFQKVANCTFRNNTVAIKITGNQSGSWADPSLTVSGNTYDIEYTGATNFSIQSANTLTVNNSGAGVCTIVTPSTTFTINSSEAGSLIQIFTTGTQTVLDSTTGTSLGYTFSGTVVVDYVVQKAGFLPQRFTGVTLTNSSVSVVLESDPVYDSGHGLTYTTDLSYNRSTSLLTLSTRQEARAIYSALIDAFIAQSALFNTQFKFKAVGPDSIFFLDDAEIIDATSRDNWKGAGIRYLSSADVVTAEWVSIKSAGTVPAGAQGEYQQVAGSGTTDLRATGAVDQIIQVYGDASHGNFDYRSHLVIKYQINGYRETRSDVLALAGVASLEPFEYSVAIQPVAITAATGDPAVSITITDHGASPVTWNSKNWSITITDSGTVSGEDILRELNYNLSLDATYEGKDPFNWPEMVIEAGSAYETARGITEGGAGATLKGVRVLRGADPHPDFTRFQADDGTYYTVPVTAAITISNLPDDVGGDTRLQIYNLTTATLIYSGDPAGTSYSDTYTDGDSAYATTGDNIRIRFAHANAGTSFEYGQTIVQATAAGIVADGNNFIVEDSVYATNGIDGSTVTKFTYTPVNDQFNLVIDSNYTAAEMFAFYCYTLTTADGIQGAYGGFVAQDAGNYKNVTSIVSIYLDNETTASKRQTDTARIYRDDGAYPVLDPTTSGFGIDVNWQNVVYVVTAGSGLTAGQAAELTAAAEAATVNTKIGTPAASVSADIAAVKAETAAILVDTGTDIPASIAALTAPDNASITAIKAKTDQLTFTKANELDANIQSVNDVTVTGTGATGDEWGP